MNGWALHEYGEAYESCPRDEKGETVRPALLQSCSPLDMQAEMLQGLLRAYGIPSISVAPGDGAFGELILGMSGTGVDILVPETMLDDAKALLEADNEDQPMDE